MSTTSLATVYQYQSLVSGDTTSSTTEIQLALDYVTSAIESYCDRVFASTTYTEWYYQNYPQDNNVIFLDQYPVTKITYVGIADNAGYIYNSNASAVFSSVSCNASAITLNWSDIYGSDNTVDIVLSSYPILSQLETQIETNTGWNFELNTAYSNAASVFITPIDNEEATNNNVDIDVVSTHGIKARLTNNRELILDNCASDIYVKYIAGYTMPQDNVGHTALDVAGNVPKDLTMVAIMCASELLKYGSDNSAGTLKSESLGDYSYTKFDDAQMTTLIKKYSEILSKYMKLWV